ncbi:MAG: hypothetical protein JWN04_1371 [Myxococcaceae bacterium]|nr:hypothetical protein [Myxococcaceae bacterium]
MFLAPEFLRVPVPIYVIGGDAIDSFGAARRFVRVAPYVLTTIRVARPASN